MLFFFCMLIMSESIQLENRTFYRSTFMEVSIIRTNDNFYNGYENFNKITRLQFWKKFYETVKETCMINISTSEIELKANLQTAAKNIEQFRELTDQDLTFEVKLRANETKWISGTYIHEILLNKLLMRVDDKYAIKVSYQIKVFELNDDYKPNIKLMKDYLRSISILDEQIITYFNTKFHRYDGKRLVKDLLKRLGVEINKEKYNADRIKLIKAMKCGQYTKEEFIDLIHETFDDNMNIFDIISEHHDILNLIPSKRGNKPYSRRIDGKDTPIYELRKEFMPPDELQELKNMIINHKGVLKDLIPYFNDKFSRHDTNRSINYFMK